LFLQKSFDKLRSLTCFGKISAPDGILNEVRRDLIVQKYDCIRKAEKGVAMFTQIGTKQQ